MKKITPTHRLIAMHIFCHLMIIPMIIYGTPLMFLLGFVWWQWIAATAITTGYHRYASHKAFRSTTVYELYFNFLGLFANAGPVLTWAAVHRMHHVYSDTAKDPHSAKYIGGFKVYTGQWGNGLIIPRRFLGKLPKNNIYMFFYRHYFKLQLATAALLLIISPYVFLFGFCLPIIFALHGFGSVNWWGHRGAMPHNSFVANILTGGEGWHRNHHEDQSNWKLGNKWYQLDTGAWWVRLIKEK